MVLGMGMWTPLCQLVLWQRRTSEATYPESKMFTPPVFAAVSATKDKSQNLWVYVNTGLYLSDILKRVSSGSTVATLSSKYQSYQLLLTWLVPLGES